MPVKYLLVAEPCTREGFETFTDLYLVWQHNEKFYKVRIRPQFGKDLKCLIASALHVEPGDPVEKFY